MYYANTNSYCTSMSGSHGDPATRLRILDLLCYNKLPIVVLLWKSHSNKIICLFLVIAAHKQNTGTKGPFDWSYVALLHAAGRRTVSHFQIWKPALIQPPSFPLSCPVHTSLTDLIEPLNDSRVRAVKEEHCRPPLRKVCLPGDAPTMSLSGDETHFHWKFIPHGC